MHRRHLLGRAMAALLAIASLLGSAVQVGAMTPPAGGGHVTSASIGTAATNFASLSDYGQPFHFLQPLAPEAGDATKFDPSLLKELIVSICRVDTTGCPVVKTLTSSSSLAEQLRIMSSGGIQSYYQANWDTSGFKLTPSTFRISVTVDRLLLGAVDVTAAQYKSFPRTWPIKFRIENNPVIRTRVLHEAGKGAGQIANLIRLEFGICGDDLVQLLTGDLDPFTQQEASLAVAGVCQNADIPSTTKVADAATQNALTSFDTSTGRLTFSTSTPTLNSLKGGDVLVSEPSLAAPNGYLRKVTLVTKNKKTGVVVVDTADALLNEAIHAGTLAGAGDLKPGDIAHTDALPGVELTSAPTSRGSASAASRSLADVGDGFDFHQSIDVTLDGATGDPEIGGSGTIRIQGEMKFNAGWNIGLGIEGCLSPPFFTCVDRFETHVGAHLYSDLHVSGTFDGHLHKDVTLATHYFDPIVLFIGPIPVVIIPVVKAIAGVDGTAHITFSFESKLTGDMALSAKWTDPDDGGHSWENVPQVFSVVGTGDGEAKATMEIKGYAAFEGKLLLYGILGPGLKGRVGLDGIVTFPGTPLWELRGFADGELNFTIDIGGILDLGGYSAALPGVSIHLAYASDQAPVCWGQSGVIPVALNHFYNLGPHTLANNWNGWFDCPDPEGGNVTYQAKEGSTVIDYTNYRWTSTGPHDVVITATDGDGNSSQVTLHFDVEDSPPILSTVEASGNVRAGVQYFVTATAWDAEAGSSGDWLRCDAMQWQATSATIRITSGGRLCTAEVIFSQAGTQTVTVTATEPKVGGKSSTHTVTVIVGNAPANPAPILSSFSVTSASGPLSFCDDPTAECTDACPTATDCPVPPDRILFNGMTGDYVPPLTLYVAASDPNGDPLTIQWFCIGNGYSYPVTDNHDGTFSCSPFSADPQQPILIWATVSDGTTFVHSEVRRLFMYSRLLVN